MKHHLTTIFAAGLLGLAASAGAASAQTRALIDCSLEVNNVRPECQGRGNTGLQYRGDISEVTPSARTRGAPAMTGSVGRPLVDCMLEVNNARPECQGRGNTGLQYRGDTSEVTPGARSYIVPRR